MNCEYCDYTDIYDWKQDKTTGKAMPMYWCERYKELCSNISECQYKADRSKESIIDKLIDDIECTTWYHINRIGELVEGAKSAEHDALYKAKDILKVLEKYRRDEK